MRWTNRIFRTFIDPLMSVNGNPKSLWTVEVLFPISVLANFLPVYIPTTQVPACHCGNSSIMKKKCPDISRRRKGKICGISAKLCWLSSSWFLLTMPRQDTYYGAISWRGPVTLIMSQYCWWWREGLWLLNTGDVTVVQFYHYCKRKVLQHFWSLEHLKR